MAPNQDKEVTEILDDPAKTLDRSWDMAKSAKQELLILFSSANAFDRQDRAGAMQVLKDLTSKSKCLKIKILAPRSTRVEEIRSELKPFNIQVKYIQEFSQTKISMLIADRKSSIVIELKDDSAKDSLHAAGQSTYSTRILTVLSYVSIFESYWTLSELHEQSENELAYTKDYLNKVLNELDMQKK